MISLSQNNLQSLKFPNAIYPSRLSAVCSLLLERNTFTSLEVVIDVQRIFPNLQMLSLQSNKISRNGISLEGILPDQFLSLTSLNLSQNSIDDYSFIDSLPHLFPNLTSLRVSSNPFFEERYKLQNSGSEPIPNSARSGPFNAVSSSFYLTLARIPKLQMLNYSAITLRDREEGEIYYVMAMGKDIELSRSATRLGLNVVGEKYKHYEELCNKYDRPSALTSSLAAPAGSGEQERSVNPNSLAARLIKITVHEAYSKYGRNSQDRSFTRLLPPSLSVYNLKAILSREWSLKPLSFRLMYESEEWDPLQMTTRSTYDKNVPAEQRYQEWGDWNLDWILERMRELQADDIVKADLMEESPEARKKRYAEAIKDDRRWKESGLGQKWMKREVELIDSTRPWSHFLDQSVKDVRVRLEPKQVLER